MTEAVPVPNDAAIRAFWARCCQERLAWREPDFPMPEAWGFGANPVMADRLGALVVEGLKTATSSAVWEYEHDGSPLPRLGDLGTVLDGRGEPLCLIETTEVRLLGCEDVPADFAHAEGEEGYPAGDH